MSTNGGMKRFARVKYEPITVKEPHKYNVQTFQDPDEFTAYYREHEDDFKGISTLVLNRTYKIPGYRITVSNRGKENEELMLRKDYYQAASKPLPDCGSAIPPIQELIDRIDNIEKFLEQLNF
jgi:hypothetical protein